MKKGDRVVMTKAGMKTYPLLKSYTGVVEELDGVSIKVRRDDVVYRGEKLGHWWTKSEWKKDMKCPKELPDFSYKCQTY